MAISKITNDGIGDINELTVDTNTLVVDSTNNRVGIGTTSPSQVLEITNGTSPAYVVQTRGDLQTILGPTGSLVTSAGQVGTITNSPFRFTTNNTERMRIDSSGNVGIGTTAPRTNLHVSGLTGDDDPALGSSVAPFLVTNTANSYGLNIGVNNQGDAWLQAQSNTTSTAYDILLSPLGGNVHIATGGSQAGATVSGTSIRSLDILKSTNTTSGFNQI
ncbi:MAG: hypothetical protein ACPIG6_11510, partial [Akkermansiaceae bacterium]